MRKFLSLIFLLVLASCSLDNNEIFNSAPVSEQQAASITPIDGQWKEGYTLIKGELEKIVYKKVDGINLLEGDIAISDKYIWDTLQEASTRSAVMIQGDILWGIVNYQISENIPLFQQRMIRDAIAHWEANTNLRFRESAIGDFIRFRVSTNGTWSYLGRQGGQQDIGLADWARTGSIIHEIGHAVGLYHEHTRADRDNHIRIHWNNIDSAAKHNFYKYSSGKDIGPFDFNSIMLYSSYAFTINNSATITRVDGTTFGTQRTRLSDGDIAGINFLYPFETVVDSDTGIIGYDLKSSNDQIRNLDFNGDGHDDLLLFRPGSGPVYIGKSNGNGTFTQVYASHRGIIGYDMKSTRDQLKVLDFNGDKKDDIICYRPGSGPVYVGLSNGNGTFTLVYASHTGIIGYDMKSSSDQLKILDFNGDNKDDIICYRPGSGPVYVGLSNGNGTFTRVYASHTGIIGYDMKSTRDQLKVLDFNGDNKDDIICYRPGSGPVYIGRSNGNGTFTLVYASQGIIGYDMKSTRDQLKVLDFNGDNKDDIICYRPGSGPVYIGRSNGNGTFSLVYASHTGIIGYDMRSSGDQIEILDYNGDNKDDIICYRPGSGPVYMGLSLGNGVFNQIYRHHGGIGSNNMRSSNDRLLVFDHNGDLKSDLISYRPGSGLLNVHSNPR